MEALILFAHKKQDHPRHYRPHAGPDWDVYCLRVLDRPRYRTQLGLMRVLGVSETAIHQPQAAGHDQHDCQNLDCVHLIFSGRDTLKLATEKPGKTEAVN